MKGGVDAAAAPQAKASAAPQPASPPVAAQVSPPVPPPEPAQPAAPSPSRAEILDDPKLNDILHSIPGAIITDIRGGRQ